VTGVNQVWVADITYIRIVAAFVYLAVILVLYSRQAIGYAISRSINTILSVAVRGRWTPPKKSILGQL